MTLECPFCHPSTDRIFHADQLVMGLWDKYPVSLGHALLIPRRHFAEWFQATPEEQKSLFRALEIAKEIIERDFHPDGFNIGININRPAGQTIFHLHVHLIPRFEGDVIDPTGGVRNVIPSKGNYLLKHASHGGGLVRGGNDPLLPRLLADLNRAKHVDLAVAFVQRSGVKLIYEHLREGIEKGVRIRLLTGDYLDITDPDALTQLLDLEIESKIYQTEGISFHPKAYIFKDSLDGGYAYVGSSNLTSSALGSGIEWNLRIDHKSNQETFGEICKAFEELFYSKAAIPVDYEWIDSYRARRKPDQAFPLVGIKPEKEVEIPEPHPIQEEALRALEKTRQDGNSAGLVVLATGLGKTWLSAFDSNRSEFQTILFVAHREEILSQARKTFRKIRPRARIGTYTGTQKDEGVDILFASVQTLNRIAHLEKFTRDQFDYIIIDEFHHAAARTYRKLIEYFTPMFLLGLTATPERTDGGDLLALCQENLVFRCDLAEGVKRGLLSPFQYFGVPDDVNYENIPWRSSRFDEDALTQAVATQTRAENALNEYRKRGGKRALGFCCSQKHSDFMSEYFQNKGIKAVSVHSGPSSDPRTASLEALEKGDISVVFTVDIFNEGVDLPKVDTILMLRPTESSVLWTQQFGRGLRKAENKTHLNVIDYIGNHRIFLVKIRSLLEPIFGEMLSEDARILKALNMLSSASVELPPECSVTYDLEAIDILKSILRQPKGAFAVETVYRDFRDRTGRRPSAVELYHEGYNPKVLRKSHGSWFKFVELMGDLAITDSEVLKNHGQFLDQLEITQMTKSYKMLVLQAMLNLDRFPGEIEIEALVDEFALAARRSSKLREDVGSTLSDFNELRRLVETNPINAWIGGRGTGKQKYFEYQDGVFRTNFSLSDEERPILQEYVRELVDWRLAEYLDRPNAQTVNGEFICKVSHAGGRPILFLPDRKTAFGIPFGETPVYIQEDEYSANFVKVALNVVTKPGSDRNLLPQILREWFGPDAGLPGTIHQVRFTPYENGWQMNPAKETVSRELELWKAYSREEIPQFFGLEFNLGSWNQGIVVIPNHVFLLVTIEKEGMLDDHKYSDYFYSRDTFIWQSQNQTTQHSKRGQILKRHEDMNFSIHLFVRKTKKLGGRAAPFIYCGLLNFVSWEGEKPISITWKLRDPLSDLAANRIKVV